jgi:hypothetical protein
VSAGNVNLEVLAPLEEAPAAGARLRGIAFEPAPLDEALGELDARGLAHSNPIPYLAPAAADAEPLWNWVHFPHWGDSLVFLCAYRPDIYTKDLRRAALDACRGGRLGLVSVTEVTVGAARLGEAIERWETLLAPAPSPEPGVWRVGDGPSIRLVPYERDTLLGLTFGVTSMERARRVIEDAGLDVVGGGRGLAISGELVGGLDIRMVVA